MSLGRRPSEMSPEDPSIPRQLDAEWVISMTEKLTKQQSVGPYTIFRVPENIRKYDPEAYDPTVVSIGPLHRSGSSNNLQPMEEVKWRCVGQLLARRRGRHEAWNLFHACLAEMKKLESGARRCYLEHSTFDLSSDKFAEILLLDGCFIIFLLLKENEIDEASNRRKTLPRHDWHISQLSAAAGRFESAEIIHASHHCMARLEETEEVRFSDSTGDAGLFIPMGDAMAPLVHDLWMRTEIKCDLLKLENQIPFPVIEALYSLLRTGGHDLVDLALYFFSGLTHGPHSKRKKLRRRPTDEVKHLLHLCYTSLLPPSEDELQPSKNGPRATMVPEWFPSATELWNVGVRFRRKETASNFLEIKFDEGVMEIPPLYVHDCSNSIFRNLMTFEQGLPVQPYITTYSMFMDCILRTSRDARLLQLSGIVLNRQGSDEDLSRFFSRLCRRIHHVYETDHLQKIFSRIREYHDRRWLRWQVSLARRYLQNPWIVVSVASATVLLLLTMEQAFFAALSYVHRRN